MIQVTKSPGARQRLHLDHGPAWALSGGGALYAVAASLTRPFSGLALVAWAIPALAALVATFVLRPAAPRDHGSRIRRTTVAWLVVLVLAATWDLVAWLQQPAYNIPSPDHPTISLLLDSLTEGGPLRLAAWGGWLWAGWRLVRR